MVLITTHGNNDGQTGEVEWPDWVKETEVQLVWSILRNARELDHLWAAKEILELAKVIRQSSGMTAEQLSGVRNQQHRRDDIIKEFIQTRGRRADKCEQSVELDRKIYRCALAPGHAAQYHAALRGDVLRIWPVAVEVDG